MVLTTTGVPPGTNTIVNNAGGDVATYGFELQSAWLINDLFSIVATYGYQANEIDEFSISSQRVPLPGNGGSGCNIAQNPQFFPPNAPVGTNTCPTVPLGGGDLGRAPEYNYSVSGVYSQDFGPYNVSLNITARGQDDFIIIAGATSSASVIQDAYSIYDARAAVQWNLNDGDLLRLSLVGKNLDDEEYLATALPLGNGGFQGWGSPRSVALELVYQH